MKLQILTLNCGTKKSAVDYGQGSYVGGLNDFLINVLAEKYYDFILLQEFHSHASDELGSNSGDYKILRMFDIEMNAKSEIAIIYRKNFILKASEFYSFANFKKWNLQWPGVLGFLMGKFQTPEGELIVGSIHLNPLFHFIVRKEESRFVKKCLIEFNFDKLPVIFGGDFNTILPGEKVYHNNIFAPEFVNITMKSGPTVDSRYIEPVILSTKFTSLLGKLGIHSRTKVDHIYVDNKTALENIISCKVLSDRVSDHSPMEVSIR